MQGYHTSPAECVSHWQENQLMLDDRLGDTKVLSSASAI